MIEQGSFKEIISTLEDAAYPNDIINKIDNELRNFGLRIASYHCIPPLGADCSDPVSLVSCFKFPEDTINKYRRGMLYRSNPFVVKPLLVARPLLWKEIYHFPDLSPDDYKLIEELKLIFGDEGVCIPVFGPLDHNGSFAISFEKDIGPFTKFDILNLQALCQQAHLNICYLLNQQNFNNIKFTRREIEVLEWLVKGKSNPVIADILGISSHTVTSYLSRIFIKLNASDRVSAAFRAKAVGAIF